MEDTKYWKSHSSGCCAASGRPPTSYRNSNHSSRSEPEETKERTSLTVKKGLQRTMISQESQSDHHHEIPLSTPTSSSNTTVQPLRQRGNPGQEGEEPPERQEEDHSRVDDLSIVVPIPALDSPTFQDYHSTYRRGHHPLIVVPPLRKRARPFSEDHQTMSLLELSMKGLFVPNEKNPPPPLLARTQQSPAPSIHVPALPRPLYPLRLFVPLLDDDEEDLSFAGSGIHIEETVRPIGEGRRRNPRPSTSDHRAAAGAPPLLPRRRGQGPLLGRDVGLIMRSTHSSWLCSPTLPLHSSRGSGTSDEDAKEDSASSC